MSDVSMLRTTEAPVIYNIELIESLSDIEQNTITSLLGLLPSNCIADLCSSPSAIDNSDITDSFALMNKKIVIKKMVDGRGLACPMPLLKTKVALRDIANGESLYVVATDPNSRADIAAFCHQTKQTDTTDTLSLIVNQATDSSPADSMSTQPLDTIFHFIITKTDSN